MRINASTQYPAEIEADWLALGIVEGDTGEPAALAGREVGALISRLLAAGELATGAGELTAFPGAVGVAAGTLLVYGLGSREKFGPGAAFTAGVAVGKRLSGRPGRRVAVVPPPGQASNTDSQVTSAAFLEGVIVGTQGPGLRKSEPGRHPLAELIVVQPTGADDLEAQRNRAATVAEAVNLARELVNLPPSEKPPARLAARAREVAEAVGITVEVWDEPRIRQERFGGLLGVAGGSAEPPAFVILRYRGAGGQTPNLALVGKGVTFDSGGLSLKPTASMEDMKADMTGAAVVLATLQAVARLGLPVDLDGYLPLAENMTGGAALKLGDVLTMRNGTTVEVLNTDAEGRLILADALAYAAEARPARLLDLATLTGACVVALGTKVAGLFSNDDRLADALLDACARTGERAWRLPLDDDYAELLKSNVADLKNVGGKWGGAITAAKFLQRFIGSTPWAHLDIAGPSWSESDSPSRDAGATGCFVRTLVRLVEAEAGPRS